MKNIRSVCTSVNAAGARLLRAQIALKARLGSIGATV